MEMRNRHTCVILNTRSSCLDSTLIALWPDGDGQAPQHDTKIYTYLPTSYYITETGVKHPIYLDHRMPADNHTHCREPPLLTTYVSITKHSIFE